MGLELTTRSSVLPVPVSELRKQLELQADDTTHTEHLERVIERASRWIERRTRRAMLDQTWTLTLDAFPVRIELPRPPLISVTTVRYEDVNGTWQTWSSSNYRVIDSRRPAIVKPIIGVAWPETSGEPQCVEVVYRAGYGTTAETVPEDLREAVVQLSAYLFSNRGDVSTATSFGTSLPLTLRELIDSCRSGTGAGYFSDQGI